MQNNSVSNKKFIFNYLATFWAIIANYLFIPLYLKYLGADWYGVLSFGAIIQSVLVLFDSGFTATLKREFAASTDPLYKHKLLFSAEKLLFLTMAVAALLAMILLPYFARNMLTIAPEKLEIAIQALQLLVFVIITQVFFFFYNGGLWGENEQEKSSILKILFSLFRNGFVLLVLMYSNSIIAFITWQIAVSVVFVLLTRYVLVRLIKHPEINMKAWSVMDKQVLMRNLGFTGGMFLISIISVINYQTDKLMLSSLLSIDLFGFYTIGFFLAQSTVSATSPIGHSIFPQLTAAMTNSDEKGIRDMCREGFIMISIISFSVSVVIFFASHPIIYAWTGNIKAADTLTDVLPFLVMGSFLQSLQFIPYHITIAEKKPKPIIIIAVINILLTVPIYFYTIREYGMLGAGVTWLIMNSIATPAFFFFILRRRLGGKFLLTLMGDFFKIILFIGGLYAAITLISQEVVGLEFNLIGYAFLIATLVLASAAIFLRERLLLAINYLKSAIGYG